MLLYLIMGHLYGCFSCFGRLYQKVQDSTYNLSFKISFIVVFFEWSTMRKFSGGPTLSIGPFQKVQREVIYFPFVVRKKVSELSKYCSIHGKNREISGPYNS